LLSVVIIVIRLGVIPLQLAVTITVDATGASRNTLGASSKTLASTDFGASLPVFGASVLVLLLELHAGAIAAEAKIMAMARSLFDIVTSDS
jgi:hypothetical protein